MSAIVALASAAGSPNSHGLTSLSISIGVHGEFCDTTASSGVGTTARRSSPFVHLCRRSREAAPKQRSLAAGAVETAMRSGRSPLSGSRSSTPLVTLRTYQ